ncbi:Aminoacyl tRNA synthase complex-interacting multifunctional protein 1 [Orchesella cincta]|uniref:Aminoacyl tRNA synthase complex-interacting multifunctional protein 1 n=1 Tax=Orchesella cincta TaxID=48709 RepID=A0A1D2NIR1_ORCCI|nr:Aminoacyl tRNA synthase complex-interacting multifunctional protein 1 [Orchesella cincta]
MLLNSFSKGVCRQVPTLVRPPSCSLSRLVHSNIRTIKILFNSSIELQQSTRTSHTVWRNFYVNATNDGKTAVHVHQQISFGFVSELSKVCNKICDFFNSFSYSDHKTRMSGSVEAMAQLENNAQAADALIQEIYSKLSVLQSCNPELGAEVQKLLQENEALKTEVGKWKEMLILQQIRNGGNPIVRDPKLIERSAVVVATELGKPEPAAPANADSPPKNVEVKAEPPSEAPQKDGKKGKKAGGDPAAQKGGKPKEAAGDSKAQESEEVDVGRLDLRIGLIKECTRHPDADSLYVEKIDVGEPDVRTVISGLVKHVPIDAMQNRMVVVLCNLKPSKMRGINSQAMVMCASSPEKVEILIPPPGSAPGDVIEVEGYVRRPDSVLNPKKKIFETVAPDLKTNDQKQATYKGVPWSVPGKGLVVSESLCGVNVK